MKKVTIVILTKNAEKYIRQTLQKIVSQTTNNPYEILIIDSGSKDKTKDIISSFPVRLHEIQSKKFDHSKTRNLACSLAKGEYVVYLTQDATPKDSLWLQKLLDGFTKSTNVAGVFSRHVPRKDCNPILAHQITHVWPIGSTKRHIKKVTSLKDFKQNITSYVYFSDTSSCIKKSILKKYPFPQVAFGEDAAWEKMILEKGYTTIFEPESQVLHSHSYPIMEQFRQHYDHVKGMKRIFFSTTKNNQGYSSVLRIPYVLLEDYRYLKTKNYTFLQLLHWTLFAARWHGAAHVGSILGANSANLPKWVDDFLSRQGGIKKGRYK